ncbi:hypothetical protein EZH22_16175 [Xanthobacter dioxanivorans]|uniref:DUF3313 domain-containing protein n=1 Tax=Xanthobacter dioxanivorans TaxID=2528964 RepID=A0A974PK11_9HYPH|nr:hypothetical protein [Xanthobacter dioxanivorans]QRG04701.1 hypothetical protein EZH22_16175 [Xanthobacter dioxanivorans]
MNALIRVVATAFVALLVGACATLPKHALSEAEIASLTLAKVKVTFPSDGSVKWAEADALETKERETPRPDLHQIERAGFRSYAEHRVAAALTTESHRLLGGILQGTRPARLEITVRSLLIPTTQERTGQVLAATALTVVLAGPIAAGVAASTTQGIFITCDIAIVDMATNAVLASVDGVKASSASAQFSGESVDSIAAAVLAKVKSWLSEKASA